MTTNTFNKLIISLYKNGLICDSNIINENSSSLNLSARRTDIIRKYINVLIPILLIIYYSICLATFIKSGELPMYYCDLTIYLSNNIQELFYFSIIVSQIMSIITFYSFNFSNKSDYYWIKIFNNLSKIKINYKIESSNDIRYKLSKLIKLVSFSSKLIKITEISLYSTWFLLACILSFDKLILHQHYLYGLVAISIWIILMKSIWQSYMSFHLCYYIMVNYSKILIKHLNSKIDEEISKVFTIHANIQRLVSNHNTICNEINKINKFWKNIYLAFIFTGNPIMLIFLNQLLFTKINNAIPICFIILLGINSIYYSHYS